MSGPQASLESPPKTQDILDAAVAVISLLVDDPDRLKIELVPHPDAEVIILRVSAVKQDLGKLIGKSGRNARSLRILLTAMLGSSPVRIDLDLCERFED